MCKILRIRSGGAEALTGVSAVSLSAAGGTIDVMRAAYGAAATIALIVKKPLFTAPMLMYQHSRSGVCCPGR